MPTECDVFTTKTIIYDGSMLWWGVSHGKRKKLVRKSKSPSVHYVKPLRVPVRCRLSNPCSAALNSDDVLF